MIECKFRDEGAVTNQATFRWSPVGFVTFPVKTVAEASGDRAARTAATVMVENCMVSRVISEFCKTSVSCPGSWLVIRETAWEHTERIRWSGESLSSVD